jgi:hypothetical protein
MASLLGVLIEGFIGGGGLELLDPRTWAIDRKDCRLHGKAIRPGPIHARTHQRRLQ